MSIKMLNRRFVAPGDLLDGHVEHGGDFLPLDGGRRPAAEDDGCRAVFLDEGPFRQSARGDMYAGAVERLLANGRAYRCDCTPEAVRTRARRSGET